MTEREALRAEMKRRRAQMSAAERAEISAEIGRRVLAMDEYSRAHRVMCYWALPSEVQTAGLIGEMLKSGREVYLPVTAKDRSMKAMRLENLSDLRKGAFGVCEPNGGETAVPEELELILVPGLAFDREGGRMGYGAGCYDRFLPRCRGTVAGLCAEVQRIERVPMEAHDVLMDCVITERAVYRRGDKTQDEEVWEE